MHGVMVKDKEAAQEQGTKPHSACSWAVRVKWQQVTYIKPDIALRTQLALSKYGNCCMLMTTVTVC